MIAPEIYLEKVETYHNVNKKRSSPLFPMFKSLAFASLVLGLIGASTYLIPVEETTTEPTKLEPKTLILTPKNQQEFDCLKWGGGLGCFDNNYVPNHSNNRSSLPSQKTRPSEQSTSDRFAAIAYLTFLSGLVLFVWIKSKSSTFN